MSEWERTTIGELLDKTGGTIKTGPFGTKLKASEYTNNGVPVISVGEVGFGRLRIHDKTPRVDKSVWNRMPEFLLKSGDIVFGRKGAVERSAQVQPEENGFFLGSDGIRIRLNIETCDPKFISYLLQTETHRTWMIQHAAGTTMPSLNEGIIRRIPIILPPLPEQKRIAKILGDLDDKIELNRQMNATLEAMARALFQSWFVDFDPVRAKAEGRAPVGMDAETAKLFPSEFVESELGLIPKGWRVGTIEDVTSLIIDYRGRTPLKMGSDWSLTGIPAVSAKNVKGGKLVRPDTFNFVSEELYERWMKDKLALGDILMTSEAPLGELYYLALDASYCLSQRLFALRANPVVCAPIYLYYWLESPACQSDIVNRGTGTTVEGIRQSELRKVSVPIPPLPMQNVAAKFLVTWMEQIHRNDEQSSSLAKMRNELLPNLLSGVEFL